MTSVLLWRVVQVAPGGRELSPGPWHPNFEHVCATARFFERLGSLAWVQDHHKAWYNSDGKTTNKPPYYYVQTQSEFP